MAPIAPETIYTKTAKGVLEVKTRAGKLGRDLNALLATVDGKTPVADLLSLSGLTSPQLQHALNELAAAAYIKAVAQPAQPQSSAEAGDELDFTSPAAIAQLNMEAASRALAAADATKRAQQEAHAALEARLRHESEARARALAETRADAEAEARAKAEAAAREAADERRRAEAEAATAADSAARSAAEARARTAAAAVVRAQAEARVRAEAEARARALAQEKRDAEDEARREAETRAGNEEQAQARAAAEARAREALEAQVQAMQEVRAQATDPTAQSAEAARALVRELEAEAERARAAAQAIAEAEGRAHEVPQAEPDIADRVRQLNARVNAERKAREEAARQPRESQPGEYGGAGARGEEAWPSLQLGAPAADFDQRQQPPSPEHVPTALERTMAEMVRQKAQQAAEAAASAAQADSAPESQPAAQPPVELPIAEAPAAPAPAATPPDEKVVPAIDDSEPLHERLNVDRTAHDIIAESTEARRKTEAAQRDAAAARRLRDEEVSKREALIARHRLRNGVLVGLAIATVLVPLAGIAWLQFTRIDGYIPDAQRALSERLNQPVAISGVRYLILPTPRLVLEGVTIGKTQGVKAERIEAHVMPLAALSGPATFDEVHLHQVEIDPEVLGVLPAWTGGRAAGAIQAERLKLTEVQLRGVALDPFDGDVRFAPNGTVREATFRNKKAKLDLSPQREGVRIALEANDWQVPHGPPFEFSTLTLRGLVDQGQIAAADFTGRVAGGSVVGALTARWPGPVTLQGEFKAEGVRLQELSRELGSNVSARGSVKATGRFSMQAASWSTITASPQVEANFIATRGEIGNIDLVRAIQAGAAGSPRGGRTAFEQLAGVFQLANGRTMLRELRLTSGPLNANGNVEVGPQGQLAGRVTGELGARGTRAVLGIGGTVQDPQLKP